MNARVTRALCVVLAPLLAVGLVVLGGSAPAQAKRMHYTPPSGPMFNNPLGTNTQQWNDFRQVVYSIRSAPKGSTIRVMSWNILSRAAFNALIAANKRGVTVRVLMDDSNTTSYPNPGFQRMKKSLYANSKNRPAARQSRAHTCHNSCRGKGGAAHSKYYLFSNVNGNHDVVMEGSMNLTSASAINQWNTLYTWKGHTRLYNYYAAIFHQAWQDKPVPNPYRVRNFGSAIQVAFFPFTGKFAVHDPVLSRLRQVRCTGLARAYGNSHGRTIVVAAPDVIRGSRGLAIAEQLRVLWDRGCDIRMVYTVMGHDVHRVIFSKKGRGPIPVRHLVQDVNCDGEFDNYFHVKALTINGRYGNDSSFREVLDGSSNWSDLAKVSDENLAVLKGTKVTLQYQKWITYWFDNPPPMEGTNGYCPPMTAARRGAVNPYAHVQMD